MKKKVLAVLLTGVLAAGVLTGCGGTADDTAAEAAASEESQDASAAEEGDGEAAPEEETAEEAAPAEEKGTITVAASPTPHAEILEAAKPILAEQGWDLEIKVFDDYVLPNQVVDSGELDANYFQHLLFQSVLF